MSYQEDHIKALKEQGNLLIKKLDRIGTALILETDPSTQFKLEHQQAELEKQLEELKTKIAVAKDGANKSANISHLGSLHDHHRYTCNRLDQYDEFEKYFAGQKDKKVQYYYLYGAEPQSHAGFFQRLAYEREGRLRDYINPDLELHCQARKVDITLEASRYPEVYKENILKKLLTAFSLVINEQEPLLEKNLNDLLKDSPGLQALGSNDYVFILLRISEWDWDSRITPLVVKWLIESFFEVELPPKAPTFLVFFGLIYEEDDSEIEDEVLAIIREGTYLQILPELEMVEKKHVQQWLAKYHMLYQNSRERRALLHQYFGTDSEYFMEDVEINLLRIIDNYNKKI